MFSVITNIYNTKTKEPTLMELFATTGKLNIFLQLEVFDVCTTGDTANIDKILSSCHTHVNMGASIFFTAAMIHALTTNY
jgi:precorrin-6B methylase 2